MTEIERLKKEQEEKKKNQNNTNKNVRDKLITEDGTLAAFSLKDNYK